MSLSIQKKIDAVEITLSISVIYFSPGQQGAGLKNCWIRFDNFNFSLSLSNFSSIQISLQYPAGQESNIHLPHFMTFVLGHSLYICFLKSFE